jgi:PBP1b-binding outer membrane lipoprotein LpoB
MKKTLVSTSLVLALAFLLTGCIVLDVHSGRTAKAKPTVGQQLVDLQKARDTGAISEAEYQTQREKVLRDQ